MSIIRLILLLVVLAGLTLLLVQNFSPALALVFLGMRTQPLPLSLWILFSIVAGGFTSVLIVTLLKVGNYFGQQTSTTSFKSTATAPRINKNAREENPRKPASTTDYTTNNEFDDWDIDPNQNNDWDFDQSPQTASSKTYAPQQPPKNSSHSDSVYSYSSQEPKNTGVGKSESIYDADYRVIIPPYQPPTKTTADPTDDDWDFFEDDDFDDDNKPTRR
ncbi:LapA family protein [Sphaerospermopsis aphanizomenoides BCCUSP55]|uniref:LapA family protein n=1 Tax=Sphaerospermopsis aphanizomenoides TaxID=459663 RepID=UPI000A52632A|nr:LapA family protein [Sphaerospermopsis aphanizomenoides]MBK1988433.1 LapA family protein [Sphaerospermopsis aphanizomenoides BCCUSP55]